MMQPCSHWMRVLLGGVLLSLAAQAQASFALYEGHLGRYPISLVMEYHNAVQRGLYFYERHRTPILLKPFIHHSGPLATDELDSSGLPSARLSFYAGGFYKSTASLQGRWTDYRTGKSLPLQLTLTGYLDNDGVWPQGKPLSLPQAASTDRHLFRIPMNHSASVVTEIDVHDKATGDRLQVLKTPSPQCNHGMHSVDLRYVQGKTQLVLPTSTHCPGTVFELNPASGLFEVPSQP